MLLFSILIGKFASLFIKTILNRNASTWPGHIALESNPDFIKDTLSKNKGLKIVFIAGTNGKTTTTKALYHILKTNRIDVVRNDSGANLLNGLASLIIKNSNLLGKINSKALLFEVDENSFPLILKEIKNPNAIILLNLFRDQLDRYGEINTTSQKWKSSLEKTDSKTSVIANADDPQIIDLAKCAKGKKIFYSINDDLKKEKKLSHAVDSTNCPNCQNKLEYSRISYSHIGNFSCSKCKFKNPDSIKLDIKTDLYGTFNTYNLTAAALCAENLFDIKRSDSIQSLEDFKPAFGRQEKITYKNTELLLLLSKNPTGFNESLKVAINNKYKNLVFALNDKIPDGRDISWIWDVDFELLHRGNFHITITGERAYDLANRLSYAGLENLRVYEDLSTAIKRAAKNTSNNQSIAILPTYSAMLEIRKILTGKSIL